MIIVKTKNGGRFINDKAVTMVEHDREKAVANAYGDNGVFFRIEDVEGVVYTNDAQPTSWNDEGSEIQRLRESLDEQREWGNKMRDEYLKIEQERDELKERVAQLEPKADPDRWWPDNVDSAPVAVILSHVGYNGYDPGYGVRLGKIFESNNIKTVGDLLRIGRRDFRKYRSVGGGSISRIDNALETLYDIKGW
ncbi:MAG: hypothetical protein IKC19_00690 [Bacteroidales bacterium]|nr:hypothetical protein [Bacteroidales bacterium]